MNPTVEKLPIGFAAAAVVFAIPIFAQTPADDSKNSKPKQPETVTWNQALHDAVLKAACDGNTSGLITLPRGRKHGLEAEKAIDVPLVHHGKLIGVVRAKPLRIGNSQSLFFVDMEYVQGRLNLHRRVKSNAEPSRQPMASDWMRKLNAAIKKAQSKGEGSRLLTIDAGRKQGVKEGSTMKFLLHRGDLFLGTTVDAVKQISEDESVWEMGVPVRGDKIRGGTTPGHRSVKPIIHLPPSNPADTGEQIWMWDVQRGKCGKWPGQNPRG